MSSRLAAYIRNHTAMNARVLTGVDTRWPHAAANLTVLLNTGRPNNLGFVGVNHLSLEWGPDYLDALRYLEPVAFRRLGLAYVYATDAWAAALPSRTRDWLADPGLFDLLARDGDEAFYRVRPAFLALKTAPGIRPRSRRCGSTVAAGDGGVPAAATRLEESSAPAAW